MDRLASSTLRAAACAAALVREHEQAAKESRVRRDDAIRDAHAGGHSLGEIAIACHMSRGQVHNVAHGRTR